MLIFGFCATVFLSISASSLLREHFFFFVFLFLFFWIGDFWGAKNLKSDSSELVISSKGNKDFWISGVFDAFWFPSDSRKLRSFSMLRRLKGVLSDFIDQKEYFSTAFLPRNGEILMKIRNLWLFKNQGVHP